MCNTVIMFYFDSFSRCDRLFAFLRSEPVWNRNHVPVGCRIGSVGKQRVHDHSRVFALAVYRKHTHHILVITCSDLCTRHMYICRTGREDCSAIGVSTSRTISLCPTACLYNRTRTISNRCTDSTLRTVSIRLREIMRHNYDSDQPPRRLRNCTPVYIFIDYTGCNVHD